MKVTAIPGVTTTPPPIGYTIELSPQDTVDLRELLYFTETIPRALRGLASLPSARIFGYPYPSQDTVQRLHDLMNNLHRALSDALPEEFYNVYGSQSTAALKTS